MGEKRVIAVLVGSLRKESFSRKLAHALIAQTPSGFESRIVEIGDLPLYNEDLDNGAPPATWKRFREALSSAAAVLFVTPEYNRSLPGGLKNALDVGSRPPGKSVFAGRPAGVVSVTPYQLGAFGANHALRQTFVFLDMPVMQQPEAYVPKAGELFDDKGALKNDDTRQFLQKFMTAFGQWIEKIGTTTGASRDFESFMARRDEIARAYVNGDGAPLEAITAHNGSASFFPPTGGVERGTGPVDARYQKDAKLFMPGGQSQLEVLQSGDGDIGFWTGFQTAKVKMQGSSEAREMKLRITEVFRRIGNDWKLVHRHADMLAEPQKPS
jgi:NAD(P)H-dependent FMN reductase/ketosteroid isomerase-like protein